MLRPLIATSASLLVLLAATSAAAQEPGRSFAQKGQLILSADRLVPLISYNNSTTSPDPNPNNASSSTQTTTISLLPNFNGAGTVYNIPRIAFDFAVIDHLTLGGSIYAAFVPSNKTTQQQTINGNVQTNTVDNGSTTIFGIAPRVGYAIPLSSTFSFWPRGGFSFTTAKVSAPSKTTVTTVGNITTTVTDSGASNTLNQWAIDLEAQFVWTPVQHFGLFFGPVIDIPVGGSNDSSDTRTTVVASPAGTNTTTNITQTNLSSSDLHIGLMAGLLGWF